MSAAKHMSMWRGFPGNGSWMLAVHTKKCARQRRRATPAARLRTLVPNHDEQFARATGSAS